MTHPLAALIAGVPRYSASALMMTLDGCKAQPSPEGPYVRHADILAALEAAPVPDLAEAEEYEACLRREGDGLSVGAADTIRALIALATAQAAQIAGLTKERDAFRDSTAKATGNQVVEHQRRKAAEAKVAELEAQIAGLQDKLAFVQRREIASNTEFDEVWSEAQAEAATLRAEVERLRGALKQIIQEDQREDPWHYWKKEDGHFAKVARTALEGKEKLKETQ